MNYTLKNLISEVYFTMIGIRWDIEFGIKIKLYMWTIFIRSRYTMWTVDFFRYLAAQKKGEISVMKNHSYFETGCCSSSRQNVTFMFIMSTFFAAFFIYTLVEFTRCQNMFSFQINVENKANTSSNIARTFLADFHWYINRGVI